MIVPKAFYLSFRCFPILLPKLALLYAFPESSAKGKVTCTTCKNAGVIMCDNTLSEFYYYYSWLPHLIDFCRPLCPACFFFFTPGFLSNDYTWFPGQTIILYCLHKSNATCSANIFYIASSFPLSPIGCNFKHTCWFYTVTALQEDPIPPYYHL